MASLHLCLYSISLQFSSRIVAETFSSCYPSAFTNDSNNGRSSTGSLKPVVISGDPPTFVSATGRRIVAVRDLHGDLDQARYALEMARVLSYDGEDLRIVERHLEIYFRGEDEIAILSLLRSLDIQAKDQGGAVFQVKGNHETMNVEGDYRYVDSGAFHECADFLAYLDDCKYDWETAFVGWINVAKRQKEEQKLSQKYWGPWNLVKRLQSVDAKAMVVRHTPQTAGVNCKYNCSMWCVDVGMSSGVLNSRPEALKIRDDKARVIKSRRDTYCELQVADYS